MEVATTGIAGVIIVTSRPFDDGRGFFSETWNRKAWAEAGISIDWVQDNHSLSRPVGTVRGLHFQRPPFAQAKLVRVVSGRILDVVVDIRRSSPSFGRHAAVELAARDHRALLVPEGFAHGFVTLEPDTEVQYKVSNYYSPSHEGGIIWNDPDLGIDWPLPASGATVSDKDARLPRLCELAQD